MTVRSQFIITGTREEQKVLRIDPENEAEENDKDNSTPRLENPIAMLKRTMLIEDPDTIPSERLGVTPHIPLLNPKTTYKTKAQANKSQLIVINEDVYDFFSESLSSPE